MPRLPLRSGASPTAAPMLVLAQALPIKAQRAAWDCELPLHQPRQLWRLLSGEREPGVVLLVRALGGDVPVEVLRERLIEVGVLHEAGARVQPGELEVVGRVDARRAPEDDRTGGQA